jgi:hypothetical protein
MERKSKRQLLSSKSPRGRVVLLLAAIGMWFLNLAVSVSKGRMVE